MRNDPYRKFNFRVEIDGSAVAHFSELTIGEGATKPGKGEKQRRPVRKLPGLAKYGNITLKRGVTDNSTLGRWHRDIVDGKIADFRKTVVITALDEAGADQARFVVTKAWPTKYDPSDLNAKGNEVAIELLELANEGIEPLRNGFQPTAARRKSVPHSDTLLRIPRI